MIAGVIHDELIRNFSRLTEIYELPIVEACLVLVIDSVLLVNNV